MEKVKIDTSRLLLGASVVCVALLTYLQTANFPFVPFTDAICFLPQAVKFAQGEGLRNIYTFTYLPDGAFVWHGFLLPLVLGGFFVTDTYIKVTIALGLMNALNILLLGAAMFRLTPKWAWPARIFIILACSLAQAGFLQGVLGRPETLSSLLISAGLLAWSCKPRFLVYGIMGILGGLSAVTSPAPTLYAAGCLGLGLLVREERLLALFKAGGIMFAAGLLAISLAFWFYPYNFEQWIWGLQQHANAVIKAPSAPLTLNLILQRFFIATGRFGMGFIFVCCFVIAIRLVWQMKKSRFMLRVLLVWIVIFLFLAILHTAYMGQFYYTLSLFPIASGLICAVHELRGRTFRQMLKICVLFSICLSAIDPLLLQAGRILGYQSLQLPEARVLFSKDLGEMPGQVGVSMDLVVLSDRTERLDAVYRYMPLCEMLKADWLVVQQHSFFYSEPPSYEKFQLVKNRFVSIQKMPGRLSQWFGVNGYGYAIYKKKNGS
jgi:hypothetical protein